MWLVVVVLNTHTKFQENSPFHHPYLEDSAKMSQFFFFWEVGGGGGEEGAVDSCGFYITILKKNGGVVSGMETRCNFAVGNVFSLSDPFPLLAFPNILKKKY